MARLIIWLVWCAIGFCLSVAGCRAGITAEKLEASVTIDNVGQVPPATVEVHYDPDRGGPGPVEGD